MIDRRRILVATVAAVGWPVTGRAQTVIHRPIVAVLDWSAPPSERIAAFERELVRLGYVSGQTIETDYRYAAGQVETGDRLAAEIVQRNPAVIVAFATPAGVAVKRATASIPIVVATADPVGAGLVSSMSRPSGNITGVSTMLVEIEAKRLELMRELVPTMRSLAFIGSTIDPATVTFVAMARAAADRAGIAFVSVLIEGPAGLETAFEALRRDKVDTVIVQPLFALSNAAAKQVAEIALRHRMPAITSFGYFPTQGGLIAYGPRPSFTAQAAARYVDRILKGAKPSDLPVEQPTEFHLVINLRTAATLGLTVPPSILIRADEVIE